MAKSSKQPVEPKPKTKKVVAVKAPVPKPFKGKRTLGGLIFPDKTAHKSIWDWVVAGAPDNVYVHDTLDSLIAAGIKIVDTKAVRGVYVRNRRGKPVPCEVDTSLMSPMHGPKLRGRHDGILVSDPTVQQSTRSMSY